MSTSRPAAPLKLVRPADDAEFVRRCVSGERAALRELFERERIRLHRLLFRIVGPSPHLDDLLQEAFLEVFRSIASFRTAQATIMAAGIEPAYADISKLTIPAARF
ncbi:MAG: sigma factor [Polyangiaceae bacterium]